MALNKESPAIALIVTHLFFFKDSLGIKKLTKVDMTLSKEI